MEDSGFHREKNRVSDRYIGYTLLKDVRYNSEPVVPKIIDEEVDENHPVLKTEKLGGEDLKDFVLNSEIDLKTKFSAILHIIKQFNEIDKAGFVLLDREPENIRVILSGDKISVRQMDIPDLYDKHFETIYRSGYNETFDGDAFSEYKRYGLDLWSSALERMRILEIGVLMDAKSTALNILDDEIRSVGVNPTSDNITRHITTLEKIIEAI